MATAGNGVSISTGGTVVFDATSGGGDVAAGACTAFSVTNRSSSANNALVNVQGVHAVGDFEGIAPGGTMVFRAGANGVVKVTIKSDSGTCTVDYGVVARL